MKPLAAPKKSFWTKPSVIAGLLALVAAAVYWPALTCAFVSLDDPFYVTDNRHVLKGLTRDGFVWAFTKIYFGGWQPVTWLSHMLDCQIYGLKPWGHHLTNLLLHLANTVLIFLVLKRMTGAVWRSAIVAALFALHPLRVESVAWVSDRKDLLSALFFLLAIWVYAKFVAGHDAENHPSRPAHRNKPGLGVARHYVLTFLFFALSLMSKQTAVVLPFVLLLLDFWPLQRALNWRRLVLEKVPFFALTIGACVIAYVAQKADNAIGSTERFPVGGRISNAFISYVRYLKKFFWPDDLTVFYPHPGTWPLMETIGAMALLAVATALIIWQARSRRWLFVGWFWFLGTLVPVIGLVQIGDHAMADRYSYIPLVGVFMALVWGAAEAVANSRHVRRALAGLAAIALVFCGLATARQLRSWRDSQKLFLHATQVSRGNHLAYMNLGTVFVQEGMLSEAEANFTEALRLKPDYPPAQLHLAVLLQLQGQTDAAAKHFEEALRLEPDYEQAHYSYGNFLAAQGNLDEAEKHFRAALRSKPDWAELQFKLGHLLCQRGDLDKGIACYQKAFELRPEPEAHIHLAFAFARLENWQQAASHLRSAIKAFPDSPGPARDLAWILATSDDPKIYNPAEAIRLAERACSLTALRDIGCLDVLAVAYSEARRFDDAMKIAGQAVLKALAANDKELAVQIQGRLKHFQEGKSYREAAAPAEP